MLNLEQIAKASNGMVLNGNLNKIIENYILDSREAKENVFFIPIVGEKVNAHNYIIDCVKKGISGFFIESTYIYKEKTILEAIKTNQNICIVEVCKSEKALYDIGAYNRKIHMEIPVIAVTGSVGKTSTKEMISSVLQTELNVLKTDKNYNGYIGLSLMLLKLEHQDIAILEHGIDRIGEMEELVNSSKPDMAIITMIGTSHIGIFKSKKTIFEQKLLVSKGIKGKLFLNDDDEFLKKVKYNNVIKYSIYDTKNIEISNNKTIFYTNIYGESKKVTINETGKHNIYNALAAIKIAEELNISLENILKGICDYKNFPRRFEKIYLNSGAVLIDDTYNASFDSMKSGLEAINEIPAKRKIVVLGDMLELGIFSEDLHLQVGKLFSCINVDIVFTYGKMAESISRNASKYVYSEHYDDKKILVKTLKEYIKSGDLIYFKASNGMKFNEIIEKLK